MKEPGITVSIRIIPPNKQPFVLAFDIKHKDLSSFSTGFKPSPNGKIFVMLDNEKATALPSDSKFTTTDAAEKYLLKDVNSLGIAATSSIIAAIMALVLSKKCTEPIHGLVQQTQSLRHLNVESQEKAKTSIREIHHLTEANERMRIALDAFSKYIPTDIVRQLLDRGKAAKIGGKTSNVTILFTDIEGFTSISEKMPPLKLALHMEEYFNIMLEELRVENATVDKFIGDATMAF